MKIRRLAAAAACLIWSATPLFGEDAQPSGSAITEEIIVTATYREMNLMDTAQSINAITDDFVEDVGAQSMADVFMMVPGLNMTGSRDGDNRYSVRGLTSQTGATGYYLVGASVGVYLDGTPVTAALGPDNQVSGNPEATTGTNRRPRAVPRPSDRTRRAPSGYPVCLRRAATPSTSTASSSSGTFPGRTSNP